MPRAISAASSACLLYPFAIEPRLTLAAQRHLWSIGFVLVALLIAVCGIASLRTRTASLTRIRVQAADGKQRPHDPGRDRLRWLALSFVPSSLLLGVTTHISTDIAAVPLLWVVPLAHVPGDVHRLLCLSTADFADRG